MALVLMLLVLLTFGLMEYGWMFFTLQEATNASRLGARNAVLPDSTNAEVQQVIQTRMTDWGIDAADYSITISAADITLLEPGEFLTIGIDIPYANVELLGMPMFPTPESLRASTSMAKEGP
jgi:hypothetical protein